MRKERRLGDRVRTVRRRAVAAPQPHQPADLLPPPRGRRSPLPLFAVAALFALLAACAGQATGGGAEAPTQLDASADTTAIPDVDEADVDEADVDLDAPTDTDTPDGDTSADALDAADAGPPEDALPDVDVSDAAPDVEVDVAIDAAPTPDVLTCSERAPATFGVQLRPGSTWTEAAFADCSPAAHAMVVPRGARWEVEATGLPADARLFVYGPVFRRTDLAGDPPPPALAQTDFAGEAGELSVSFEAHNAGEQVVVIERDDIAAGGEYAVRAVCREGCGQETTRYPVVLVHGYAGTESYFGLLDYFYDIHDPLEDRGYDIYTPTTDPIALSTRRAEQLAEQLDTILRDTGAAKVNLIAHSQGGLDARLLISSMGYDDRVASLTTIATPHLGVPAVLFEFVTVQSFSPEVMEAFNRDNPDMEGVRYWSWSARSCSRLDFSCQREENGEVIEPLIIAPFAILSRFGANDGIVPTDSMIWGTHLGRLSADHFDQIGQVADWVRSGDPFDHRAFYLEEVRRLAAAGL